MLAALRWFLVCLVLCLSAVLIGGLIWDAVYNPPGVYWGRDAP